MPYQFQTLTGRRRKPNYRAMIEAQTPYLSSLYAEKSQDKYRKQSQAQSELGFARESSLARERLGMEREQMTATEGFNREQLRLAKDQQKDAEKQSNMSMGIGTIQLGVTGYGALKGGAGGASGASGAGYGMFGKGLTTAGTGVGEGSMTYSLGGEGVSGGVKYGYGSSQVGSQIFAEGAGTGTTTMGSGITTGAGESASGAAVDTAGIGGGAAGTPGATGGFNWATAGKRAGAAIAAGVIEHNRANWSKRMGENYGETAGWGTHVLARTASGAGTGFSIAGPWGALAGAGHGLDWGTAEYMRSKRGADPDLSKDFGKDYGGGMLLGLTPTTQEGLNKLQTNIGGTKITGTDVLTGGVSAITKKHCIIITACTDPYSYEVNIARQYRDLKMDATTLRGYYMLAEKLVPLIHNSDKLKNFLKKNFVDRLVDVGEYELGFKTQKPKLLSRIITKGFLFGCHSLGLTKSQFIRCNGEVY